MKSAVEIGWSAVIFVYIYIYILDLIKISSAILNLMWWLTNTQTEWRLHKPTFISRVKYNFIAPPMLSTPYRGGGFECSWDSESYTGGSVATGSTTQADRSRGRSQRKRDTLVLQVAGWAWGRQTHTEKIKLFRNPEEGQGSQRAVVPVMIIL
jgi:hypothetical protein